MLCHVWFTAMLGSARKAADFCFQAFEYAYHYWEVLDVGVAEPSIVYRQHSSHLFWNPISFQQRVCNFGWEKLPAPQQ
jgi:hypothetical protein